MKITELDKFEAEAAKARFTLGEVIAHSGIARSTITRSRQKGEITVQVMRRLESALDEMVNQGDATNG